jgi:hypothetical protein
MHPKYIVPIAAFVSAVFLIGFAQKKSAPTQITPPAQPSVKPRIQVVFALDATGSMAGLISAAKEKIWSIAGSLAQADPSPQVEIGLIFYRDIGDEFVTRLVPLSGDMDEVYQHLMTIDANGGGDTPESVNQALNEAITKFKWDSSAHTYKTVFLVGDCPPHMDYRNDVKYPVSCALAKHKDIILNTILMGNDGDAKLVWKTIANCNQGSYTQVGMDANDIAVNTPYDSTIAAISDQLDDTRIYYGTRAEKEAYRNKLSKSKYISSNTKDNVKAQRADYNATATGKDAYYGQNEMVQRYQSDKGLLDKVSEEELPDEMKGMTTSQREQYIAKKTAVRDSLGKELVKYSRLRQQFIEKDLKSRKAEDVDSSFTNKIYKSIQRQTEKKNIRLKEAAKY